jgi:hypothetical protein
MRTLNPCLYTSLLWRRGSPSPRLGMSLTPCTVLYLSTYGKSRFSMCGAPQRPVPAPAHFYFSHAAAAADQKPSHRNRKQQLRLEANQVVSHDPRSASDLSPFSAVLYQMLRGRCCTSLHISIPHLDNSFILPSSPSAINTSRPSQFALLDDVGPPAFSSVHPPTDAPHDFLRI